ncbi:hypothetical protein FE257_007064 [Aspergillus nanangensis]|uniref:Myb-like domain-containing protein n=1 Tax=Aspergillus nanangensis TaxID=2582783 RepID=A0AAD4CQ53_ASPNN|nr:hypothetical protein FE257_007064 [Aspergillus nanangensis]
MPVIMLEGERCYFPSMGFSRNTTEEWFTNKGQVRVKRAPDHAHTVSTTNTWSKEDDSRLRELKALYIPWQRISVVLGDRPVRELKERWRYLQGDHLRRKGTEVVGMAECLGSRRRKKSISGCGISEDKETERHVSFSDPLVTDGDTDDSVSDESDSSDDSGQPRKRVRRIIYINEEFCVEDVILLHQIASEWKRDRWLTISNSFSEKTGRSMTPEQAQSILGGSEADN